MINAEPKNNKIKNVSFSQFSNYFICPYKYYRDYILKERVFEDNLIMTFGTAIHETIQLFLKAMFKYGYKRVGNMDVMKYFIWSFKRQIKKKNIPYTLEEFNEFVNDGKNILFEFIDPSNYLRYFSRDQWELLGIEDELNIEIRNNVNLTGFIDLVLKNKKTGKYKIIDFKTSNNGWNKYQKEDFTKTSQLVLYKALYSKIKHIQLTDIDVEFFILKRKLYTNENSQFKQSRIDIFKPNSHKNNISLVIQEFGKFVDYCFTPDGNYKTDIKYLKNPGPRKKNCKYCQYLNKKCDAIQELKD